MHLAKRPLTNISLKWVKSFPSVNRLDWLRGSPSFLFNGYRDSFPGVKRPGKKLTFTATYCRG